MSSIGQAIHNTFSPKIILGRQDSDDPQRSKWKDPRVIIPLLAIVLLAVGGTIGGVVVGTRSDDDPSATPASSGNSSTTTDSVGTAEFTPPVANKWYRIINEIGNDKRALHADNWDSIKALPIEDSNKQFWQFIPTSVNISRIRNRGSSQPNRLQLLEDYYVGIENDLPSDNPMFDNLLWDFVEGKEASKTTRVIQSEVLPLILAYLLCRGPFDSKKVVHGPRVGACTVAAARARFTLKRSFTLKRCTGARGDGGF